MLQIDHLYFAYGEKKVLDNLSFSARKGEVIALIGVSGSGKTTLFRLISGLIPPSCGKILIEGNPSNPQFITYMRQEDLLLPWRTVIENLLLFSELGRKKRAASPLKQEAQFLLKKVGLEGYESFYPDALSGGMRGRVALARALLQNRPLLLLDEPFASLDVMIREHLYALLRAIQTEYSKTMLIVTHDFRDALAIADRILVLASGKIAGSFLITPEIRQDAKAIHQITDDIRAILETQVSMMGNLF